LEVVTVIRTNGERTAAACEWYAKRLFANVQPIRVAPFAEAVRECFRIGIASRADWLVTIDADLLVLDGALNLLRVAKRTTGWQVLGRVRDRLYGGIRRGGVRVYRVATLDRVLPLVRDDAIRPEGDLAGIVPGVEMVETVTALHDYEQWYADLYRKGAAHRIKHPNWNVERWRKSEDRDLRVAYAGWIGSPMPYREKKAFRADEWQTYMLSIRRQPS
jgi:hypothetical protein